MDRYHLPNPKELIIAKGTIKGTAFVAIGIIRQVKNRHYLVTTVGPKITWSAVTKWDYLSDVAKLYDIWNGDPVIDPLGGVHYADEPESAYA